MTNKVTQDQAAADGSTAIQAGGDVVIHNGITYTEARQIALDICQSHLRELTDQAKQVAQDRAEEVTDAFLEKLMAENPEGIGKAREPGFQFALGTVQKEYARTGDEDLADLLVDLLVDRTKQPNRDLVQIVLDESLATAPKLTEGQLANLAVMFLFKYTQNYGVNSHKALGKYFDDFVRPFAEKLVKSTASFQHLEFTGCGSSLLSVKLESRIGEIYPGLFVKGVGVQELEDAGLTSDVYSKFFRTCLNDGQKIQVDAINEEALKKVFEQRGASEEDQEKIKRFLDVNKMNDQEIREKCIEIRDYMENVFDTWSNSGMTSFRLTSVGIAIAHANIKRLVGKFADLSIWIH